MSMADLNDAPDDRAIPNRFTESNSNNLAQNRILSIKLSQFGA